MILERKSDSLIVKNDLIDISYNSEDHAFRTIMEESNISIIQIVNTGIGEVVKSILDISQITMLVDDGVEIDAPRLMI